MEVNKINETKWDFTFPTLLCLANHLGLKGILYFVSLCNSISLRDTELDQRTFTVEYMRP